MNPLPRFLAMALFVVLATLVAMLGAPLWQEMRAGAPERPATGASAPAGSESATGRPGRMLAISQRVALLFAATALVLSGALLVSQSLRSARNSASDAPFQQTRMEVGALATLAKTSVAQGEELSRERDVRRRAEEDLRLKQQLLAQSVDEKIRLGRDLHDGIIQSLYAAGLTLETVRTFVKTDPDEADRRLEKTRASLNSAIRDVRAYIEGLAPENLRRAGFGQAVTMLMQDLNAGTGARFEVQIDDEAAALLTPEQSIEALQIAREAVSNALRHGGASVVTLRMHKSERELCLLVQDNGAGFDATREREGGHGLGNMRARAGRLGASLRITSQPGEGTRVLATLPLLAPTAA
jgi:signal transduction histidine kinase